MVAGPFMVAGVLLPTFTMGGSFPSTQNSFDLGDSGQFSVQGVLGILLALLSVVVGMLVYADLVRSWWLVVSALAVGVGTVALVINLDDQAHRLVAYNTISGFDASNPPMGVGAGVWVLLVGALLALLGGLLAARTRHSRR